MAGARFAPPPLPPGARIKTVHSIAKTFSFTCQNLNEKVADPAVSYKEANRSTRYPPPPRKIAKKINKVDILWCKRKIYRFFGNARMFFK